MDAGQLQGSISLCGMEVPCRVGVLPGEADVPQPVHVEVTVHLDLSRAAASDALADTLDYRALVEIVRSLAAGRSYHLLEAMGARILQEIARDPRVLAVEVRLRKVRPPLGPEAGAIAIELRHEKESPPR
jgi:dihydroneopterin aldolase